MTDKLTLYHGDCLEVLRSLPDCSVDSIVTDPPYGLSFMGKRWDYDVPSVEIWKECLRVLKPGGYLLSFAGTRTQHRMAVRIEDAGFEILDPKLALKYEFNTGTTFDNNGSKTLVAKIDEKDITVDEFFSYMKDRIGVFYSVEVAKSKLLLSSDEYVELYGEETRYFKSNNEDMKQHVADLEEMKGLFGSGYYANYGYSSATMTWEEFMYLAFSLETESEVLENMFIIPAIQNIIMHDQIDYADTVTTDVFSVIEGSRGYIVDGEQLFDGARVLVTADTDSLTNNKIYVVRFSDIQGTGTQVITLTEAENGLVLPLECTFAFKGYNNQGKDFYFDGIEWLIAQQKTTVNQAPYFDIFDNDGISFGNTDVFRVLFDNA